MKLFSLSALLVSAATALGAAPLLPGGVVFPTGQTFADPVHGGGQLIVNDELIGFRMDPTPATPLTDVGGQLQNRVTRRSGGGLNFMPRIRDTFNIDGGFFAITGMRLTGFGMANIDADFRTDGSGDKGPTSYSRSVDGDIITMRYTNLPPATTGGLVVGALFGDPQEESLFHSLVSDATEFALTGTATIFGYQINADEYRASGRAFADGELISVTVDGVAVPVAAPAVPLPASVLMLGAGVAGFGLMRRKGRKA
jgi:hypothetical protein